LKQEEVYSNAKITTTHQTRQRGSIGKIYFYLKFFLPQTRSH
jgi:hypothetical protein